MIAGLCDEDVAESLFECWPLCAIPLRKIVGREPQLCQQLGIELWLDCAERHIGPIGAFVDLVEVGAGVDVIGATWPPESRRCGREKRCCNERGTIDHCGVDDLAAPRHASLERCSSDAHCEHQPTASEVANKVDRRRWLLPFAAEDPQRT